MADGFERLRKVAEDKLKGGLADRKPASLFDSKALQTGTEIEFEHTNNRAVAKEISKDHLTEDKDYYKKLKKYVEKKALDLNDFQADIEHQHALSVRKLKKYIEKKSSFEDALPRMFFRAVPKALPEFAGQGAYNPGIWQRLRQAVKGFASRVGPGAQQAYDRTVGRGLRGIPRIALDARPPGDPQDPRVIAKLLAPFVVGGAVAGGAGSALGASSDKATKDPTMRGVNIASGIMGGAYIGPMAGALAFGSGDDALTAVLAGNPLKHKSTIKHVMPLQNKAVYEAIGAGGPNMVNTARKALLRMNLRAAGPLALAAGTGYLGARYAKSPKEIVRARIKKKLSPFE